VAGIWGTSVVACKWLFSLTAGSVSVHRQRQAISEISRMSFAGNFGQSEDSMNGTILNTST